jgi:hypothetical protein
MNDKTVITLFFIVLVLGIAIIASLMFIDAGKNAPSICSIVGGNC